MRLFQLLADSGRLNILNSFGFGRVKVDYFPMVSEPQEFSFQEIQP